MDKDDVSIAELTVQSTQTIAVTSPASLNYFHISHARRLPDTDPPFNAGS